MIIFPAVDIQNGKAVRLKQGRAEESTVFENDPIKAALSWQEAGAQWLHVVDLDGAFGGRATSYKIVADICQALRIPVQIGGGIRDMQTAQNYIDAGVERLIIGTIALEEPKLFADLCIAFPGRVGISLDADNGTLKTKGWVEECEKTIEEVLPRLQDVGAAFIIYTDIARDGMQSGVNVAALERICKIATIPVIAAGGVATLDDVKALYPLSVNSTLQGAISGRALYEDTLNLQEAHDWIAAQK